MHFDIFDVKNLLKYYQILVIFSNQGQENALPIQAVTEKKSRKRLSFARARPNKIHGIPRVIWENIFTKFGLWQAKSNFNGSLTFSRRS